MNKILFTLLFSLMFFHPAFAAEAPAPEPPAAGLPSVGYALIEDRDSVVTKHYLGSVEAINHVDVLSRTNGFVKSVNFSEGGMVEAGQTLFELDPSVHESAVERATAVVSSAEASVRLTRLLNERAQTLVTTNAVSRNEADTAFANFSVAEAALREANAALHLAETELGFTKITAPISGRAGLSRVSVGSYVHSATGPLVDIAQLDPIRVVIPVREADFIAAAAGGTAGGFDLLGKDFAPRLRLADGGILPEHGTLDALPNRVDPLTGTVDVRAKFPNVQRLLLPGGMVDVTFASQSPTPRPAVPAIALQQDREGYFVLLLDADNRVERRPVELGQQIGRYFVVQKGLQAGDRVVVDGIQHIRPGIRVAPVRRTAGEE